MREAALHNMGHLSKFTVTLLAGSEVAARKSNCPSPRSLISPKNFKTLWSQANGSVLRECIVDEAIF